MIWTVGHSNIPVEEFLDRVADVDLIADVRRFPCSTRNPGFNGDTLGAVKPYRWFEDLGGRRSGDGERHPAWRVPAFRSYAAYMETDQFRRALAQLEEAARKQRTAIMCAEALWWKCHRRLISDALVARGWTVVHLPGNDEHRISPMARVEKDGTLVYDLATTPASKPAFDRRGKTRRTS